MLPKTISEASIHRLLKDLGFSCARVRGLGFSGPHKKYSHFVFQHVPSDTLIMLPDLRGRTVPLHNLVAIRVALDANGLKEAEEFERFCWTIDIMGTNE
jgi:hypothetical protein